MGVTRLGGSLGLRVASLIAARRRSLSTLWMSVTSGRVRAILLRWRWPMRCQWMGEGSGERPGVFPALLKRARRWRASALFQSSWGRLSPRLVAAGGDEFGGFGGADVFGDADERDFTRGAACGFGGAGDAFLNTVEILGNRHGVLILHQEPPAKPGADERFTKSG